MADNIKMKTQSKYVNVCGKSSRLETTVQSLFVYRWHFYSSFNDVISETDCVSSIDRMVFNDEMENTGRPFYRVPENSNFIA